MFLGRLDPIKGAHDAIEIARRAGRRLIIAGTRVASGPDVAYFDREIAPHVDGESVRFIGPVDDAAKDRVLGTAAALLMPIGWEEPFGIVMAEAFACGTPVIAFARGSVPEVIREGVNGFACRTVDEAADAVRALGRIDRRDGSQRLRSALRGSRNRRRVRIAVPGAARGSPAAHASAPAACELMPKRVLMISPHFPPDSTAGTHRVRLLAPRLREHGWAPTVLTVDPRDYEGPPRCGAGGERAPGSPCRAQRAWA